MDAKHIDLRVENFPDKTGNYWRMVDLNANGNDRFKNPHAKSPDTIRWHAPEGHAVSIVILSDSPFSYHNEPVTNKVIDIPAGEKSDKYDIAEVSEGLYEYAALVKEGEKDYTYVSGESSPPGVVVYP